MMNDTSILVNATKHIKELKQKVETLIQEDSRPHIVDGENPFTQVTVDTLDKGFVINVSSEMNSQGLLVAILEAFEGLGLDIHEARVSCAEAFHLEAIGGARGQVESMNAQVVKRAVLRAMDACRKNNH